MGDRGGNGTRVQRLMIQASAENRDIENRVLADLQYLIDLLKAIQPIRWTTVWPVEIITYIAAKQQWRCATLDCPYGELKLDTRTHHVDHIIPWSKGGGNETANIQILHATCNLRKGARASTADVIRYLQGRLRNI